MAETSFDAVSGTLNSKFTPDYAHKESITALPYTAPKDGFIMIEPGTGWTGGRNVFIDNIRVGGMYNNVNAGTNWTSTFIIGKGQVFSFDYGILGTLTFVPWKA